MDVYGVSLSKILSALLHPGLQIYTASKLSVSVMHRRTEIKERETVNRVFEG